MNYLIKGILLLVVVSLFFSCNDNKKEIVAKYYMQNVAEETNKKANLPAQVDEYTIADKVRYDAESNTIIYSYRLSTSEYSINDWIEHLKNVEKEQVNNAKELHSDNEYYKALEVTIESIYKDLNGNEIYRFKIKPEQYLK